MNLNNTNDVKQDCEDYVVPSTKSFYERDDIKELNRALEIHEIHEVQVHDAGDAHEELTKLFEDSQKALVLWAYMEDNFGDRSICFAKATPDCILNVLSDDELILMKAYADTL